MTFEAVSHNLHGMRGGTISRFFSKVSVQKLQIVIRGLIYRLCNNSNSYVNTGQFVNIFMCTLLLTICHYEVLLLALDQLVMLEEFLPKKYEIEQPPS